MKNVLLFTALMGFFVASCEKKDRCPDVFELPVQLSPAKKEYRVGDTISIVSKFHKEVKAFNFEGEHVNTIDMEGVAWLPVMYFNRLDTLTGTDEPAASDFRTLCQFLKDTCCTLGIFDYSDGGNSLIGEYQFARDSFCLKYRLILTKAGSYILSHYSENYAGNSPRDYPGKCPGQPGFDVNFRLNAGVDNNVDLLATSPEHFWNTYINSNQDDRFHKRGRFCFKVLP
ncbi:MAG: hypothetical protein J0L99_12020 [Chitinophagales bacterium]|nr:hypothetical protein [Chitinophagales bacterium]